MKVDEQVKTWETMAYWYPRPYSIGKKGAESLGAKILEYEDEVYNQWDDEGNPIFKGNKGKMKEIIQSMRER